MKEADRSKVLFSVEMMNAGLDALYAELPEKSPSGALLKDLSPRAKDILRVCNIYTAMRMADET